MHFVVVGSFHELRPSSPLPDHVIYHRSLSLSLFHHATTPLASGKLPTSLPPPPPPLLFPSSPTPSWFPPRRRSSAPILSEALAVESCWPHSVSRSRYSISRISLNVEVLHYAFIRRYFDYCTVHSQKSLLALFLGALNVEGWRLLTSTSWVSEIVMQYHVLIMVPLNKIYRLIHSRSVYSLISWHIVNFRSFPLNTSSYSEGPECILLAPPVVLIVEVVLDHEVERLPNTPVSVNLHFVCFLVCLTRETICRTKRWIIALPLSSSPQRWRSLNSTTSRASWPHNPSIHLLPISCSLSFHASSAAGTPNLIGCPLSLSLIVEWLFR